MADINTGDNQPILNLDAVYDLVDNHISKGKRALIAILQDIQDEYGFLPEKALNIVSEKVRIPMAQIYGVATFYSQFRLKPLGKYVISVCDGTACHVRGSSGLIDEIRSHLGINPDETTEDGLFTLKVVACIGACSLAPAIVINDEETYAKVTPQKLSEIVEDLKKKDN
jgi:NADH-quinone oxidoreductase E subunit